MALGQDTANRETAVSSVAGALQGAGGASQRDRYEAGTFNLTRQGRYRVFANAFSGRPNVIITASRAAATGTVMPVLMGSFSAAGSFQARVVATGATNGTIMGQYFAIGPR